MKTENIMSNLSEEVKQKLAACKTHAEMEQVLAEAGIEPLDDELLDAVAGGLPDLTPRCETNMVTVNPGFLYLCSSDTKGFR